MKRDFFWRISYHRLMHFVFAKVITGGEYIINNFIIEKEKHYQKIEKYYLKRSIKSNKQVKYIDELTQHDVKRNSVLAIEINDFHGATFANYVQYFIDLGYDTHVLLQNNKNLTENPFQLIKADFKMWAGTLSDIQRFLRSGKRKYFKVVFINTLWYKDYQNIFTALGCVPRGREGLIGIEHNVATNKERFHEDFYFQNDIFATPGGFRGTRMINSTRVGERQPILGKSKDYCRFAVIGALSSNNRNFRILFQAMSELIDKGFKKFEVKLIGPGQINIPEKILPYIKMTGWVDYKKLYTLSREADFIVSLFDYYIEEHRKYLDSWFTGAAQLSWGFYRPLIMQKEFANSYFLTNDNAVLFEKHSLAGAMERAILMEPNDYIKMQEEIRATAQQVERISKNNIIEMLENQRCI